MDGRQLTRSETDKRIAGVCGGLAEYFGIDSVLVRIAFVILALMGPGVLVYFVLWIVMPRGQPAPTGAPSGASGAPFWRTSPAVRIAEERFARGEISGEELAQIRTDLTRSS
jgi:phage shock protein PspC (stress-responsive transcriptional regulator)